MYYAVRRILKSEYLPRPFPGNFLQAQKAAKDWERDRDTPWMVLKVITQLPFTSEEVGLYATKGEAKAACAGLNAALAA